MIFQLRISLRYSAFETNFLHFLGKLSGQNGHPIDEMKARISFHDGGVVTIGATKHRDSNPTVIF